MKKSKKIIFSILGASSLISLPLVAISCSKLTSKQKQVKSKIKQLLDMAKKDTICRWNYEPIWKNDKRWRNCKTKWSTMRRNLI
ncbi:hypothetical protein HU153_02540 [Metamycoplasma hominis]|uniref:hypothetical protein n=1 Tax=Metamycoplasma hominis TaxID=2098 RepID=UPI001593F8F8|nr:hypothetical protein [Metamycoplasma hominis]QKX36824.1 hypothetical protein HU153_02540 [Metamycoplasma hominis]